MRILAFVACVITALAGCATRSALPLYGNYANGPVAAEEKAMADDVAGKLAATYPPARTRFTLQHNTPDAFGISLVALLRKKGYAMGEFRQPSVGAPLEAPRAKEQPVDLSLAYIVDQPLEEPFYRVTVLVNGQTLSRLYRSKDGSVSPAAYWIRKE